MRNTKHAKIFFNETSFTNLVIFLEILQIFYEAFLMDANLTSSFRSGIY